ncbi:hypothetical protein [Streptomyces millisiae]|uniref:Uncharacterized protein n=1 Tax=Streptomyces millisiae TaxID=3075542 RepID=A0ABU2LV32_9ACTN|nr:hypothetical protein [Streptomyces sp. DSM 44918]MDT0321434.1 hypothetical protein [Streptomyces sp. DSM 44918]
MAAIFNRFRSGDADGAGEVPLLERPAPPEPAVFDGAEAVDGYVVLRGETPYGGVGLAHCLRNSNGDPRHVVDELYSRHWPRLAQRYATVVVAQGAWRASTSRSPELLARDILPAEYDGEGVVRTSDSYRPSWKQVATVLGTPAPYWLPALRDEEAMRAWRPGQPPAVVPASHHREAIGQLTELAADEPEGSPAGQVCLWLARELRRRDHRSALRDTEDLRTSADSGQDSAHLVLGAVPAPLLRGGDNEQLPETLRRAGWLAITERRDVLAHRVARLSRMWNGGDDWHTGEPVSARPDLCPTAAEWARRLEKTPRDQAPTVLQHQVLTAGRDPKKDELLHDPVTGLPALRRQQRRAQHLPADIYTLTLQRLPTTSPLDSVILSGDTVWVRTEDGRLWFAPERCNHGVSWGYNGSGPHTLAQLLDRLLDDISAPAIAGDAGDPPAGLLQLMVTTPQDTPTTYSRAQLLVECRR